MINANVDYRSLAHRQEGFDRFYKAMCESEDVSPDLACERWIADDANWDFEKRCVLALHNGATYSDPVESMFADKFPLMTPNVEGITRFFKENKARLKFSPDAKYRKMKFERFLASVGKSIEPYGTLGDLIKSCYQSDDTHASYRKLQELCIGKCLNWGRIAHRPRRDLSRKLLFS